MNKIENINLLPDCNNCATGIKRGRFFSPAIAVCRIFVIFAG